MRNITQFNSLIQKFKDISVYSEISKSLQEIIDAQDKQALIEKLRNDLLLQLHDVENEYRVTMPEYRCQA